MCMDQQHLEKELKFTSSYVKMRFLRELDNLKVNSTEYYADYDPQFECLFVDLSFLKAY